MMAYVLINTEIGCIPEVLTAIQKVKNVTEAHSVYGVYDIVAKIEAENMGKLKDVVTWKIRRLNNVRSTLTMIVMEDSS
jgi:DNA-binding Lrp family transcriptional regulator